MPAVGRARCSDDGAADNSSAVFWGNTVNRSRPLALGAVVAIACGSLFASSAAVAAPGSDIGTAVASVPICPTESVGVGATVDEIADGEHFANGDVPASLSGGYSTASADGTLRITIQSVSGDGNPETVYEDEFSVSGGSWSHDISGAALADDEYMLRIEAPGTEPSPGLLLKLSFSVGDVPGPAAPTIDQISNGEFIPNESMPSSVSGTYAETTADGELVIQVVDKGKLDEESSLMLHDQFAVSGGTWSYDLSDLTFADSRYMIFVGVPSGISHRGTEAHFCVGAFWGDSDEITVSDPTDGEGDFADGTEFAESAAPREVTGTGTPGAMVEVVLSGAADVSGTAVVAEDGTWSVQFDEPLPAGDYRLAISQTVDGELPQTVAVSFRVLADEPDADTDSTDAADADADADADTTDADADADADTTDADADADADTTDATDADGGADAADADADATDAGADTAGADATDTAAADADATQSDSDDAAGTDSAADDGAPDDGSSETNELAVTGAPSVAPAVLAAAGLFAVGGFVLLLARRRRA